jgi:hypothetical protein
MSSQLPLCIDSNKQFIRQKERLQELCKVLRWSNTLLMSKLTHSAESSLSDCRCNLHYSYTLYFLSSPLSLSLFLSLRHSSFSATLFSFSSYRCCLPFPSLFFSFSFFFHSFITYFLFSIYDFVLLRFNSIYLLL